MISKRIRSVLLIVICSINFLLAQPFTLDKNIKPLKLQLTEHPKYEGAKYFEGSSTLNKGELKYHFVKGHDIYQYVDIFIFANDAQTNLTASVVYNTWSNIEETQTTKASKQGFINFKVRSYQDIGFTVSSEATKDVPYTVLVNASPELKTYLGSPFVKASKKQMGLEAETKTDIAPIKTKDDTQSNIWMLIVIGVLLLVVGLLAGKLIGRKKALMLTLFMLLAGMSPHSHSQTLGIEEARQSNVETEVFHRRERNAINQHINGEIDSAIGRVNDAFATEEVLEEFIRQYRNLGSCLGSSSPPGQPRIPSFCNGEESECANCFASARAEFNRCRYNLEKLQTIYNCSRDYIDASIALGDNVSGYHGVVGIVWQSQKRGIMRSVDDLEKAYDSKRLEMLESFHESLIELNDCEAAHGMEDWYDRFGVMFYNFVEMRYHR